MTSRVLVVDDDQAMVRTLCDILRLRGWECDGVHSGQEAVNAACSGSYSTAIMDITMPGMDGVTACREMKNCSPEVRVLLMTAHGTDSTIAAAAQGGAYRVLSKPLDLPNVLTLLK
ncbi:MAG TPA: response regulator [Gemmatimonadales bacterium]